jgi:hypothetical protein
VIPYLVQYCIFTFIDLLSLRLQDMIFFEGFGSLFPYVIYLALIWICLLFGFKGQISQVFKNINIDKKEIKAESFDQHTSLNNRFFQFWNKVYQTDSGTMHKQFRQYSSLLLLNLSRYSILFFDTSMQEQFNNSLAHRGPPANIA